MATARDIEGVNPSYFASMPTVALDPKASKADPQYARMLTDAMQNRAQATDRRRENDEANVFKAREQSQQARRDRRSNEISKRNAAVNEASEKRYQGGQDFEQERTRDDDTRKLLAAAMHAYNSGDETTFGHIARELDKRGVKLHMGADESLSDFEKRDPRLDRSPPAAAPPAAPSVDRTPVGPRPGPPPPTASFPPAGEAEAAPPMRGAPAGVAPRSTASFPPASGAPPPGPAPGPAPAPAPRPPASPTEGIPFINKTQDMSWIEGKQPPPSMPPRPMASDNAQFFQDMEWRPPPAPARPMASDNEQFYRDMAEGRPPSDTDLLNMAISKIVKGETGRDIQIPPTEPPRALLPGRTSLLGKQ